MRFIRLAAIAAVAFASIGAAHPDWTNTVAVTPDGSHVLGNPGAKVKLTEYLSYTCPHCANFHKQSEAALKLAYIQPGKVSIEVRHFLRDPIDLAAALATNCGDPKKFFGNHHAILQNQDTWIMVMGRATDAQRARWSAAGLAPRMRAIASDFGFYELLEPRGYSRATLDRCLGDEAMAKKLSAQTAAASAAGVEGTPSFMLNGVLLAGTHDWKSLATQIDARF